MGQNSSHPRDPRADPVAVSSPELVDTPVLPAVRAVAEEAWMNDVLNALTPFRHSPMHISLGFDGLLGHKMLSSRTVLAALGRYLVVISDGL